MKVLSSMVWWCLIILFVSIGAQAGEGLVLWNKLGSQQEVENSEVGPDGVITWVSSTIDYSSAMFGNGVRVNGTTGDTKVVLPLRQLTGLPRRGTLESWVKPDHDSNDFGIRRWIESEVPPEGDLRVGIFWEGWNGRLVYWWAVHPQPGAGITIPNSQISFAAGDLVHVAIVWDVEGIDGSDDALRAYFNGELKGTSNTILPVVDRMSGVKLGASDYSQYATVDNLIIWDYAKTDFSHRFSEDPRGGGGDTFAFAEFSIDRAILHFRPADPDFKDGVLLRGSFALSEDTDGIDPLTEDMTVTVDSYTLTIPAGSFVIMPRGPGYRYVYRDTVDEAEVFAKLSEEGSDAYVLYMLIGNIDLAGTANPVAIGLAVGNDSGEVEQRLQGMLYKRKGEQNR